MMSSPWSTWNPNRRWRRFTTTSTRTCARFTTGKSSTIAPSRAAAAVVRLGLTDEERAMRLDIANFMKIAPLAVQAECSAWRALGYFARQGF